MALRIVTNNFSNLDETRPVNTPRSLTACAMEGILPSSLVQSNASPRRKSVVGRLDAEKHKLKLEAQEHERQQLLQLARARYKTVCSSNAVASSEALRTIQGGGAGGGKELEGRRSPLQRGTPAIAKGMEAALYDASLSNEAAAIVADDVTVAKQFLRLKKALEDKKMALSKLEAREANGVQRYESLQRTRAEEVAARSQKFESTLKRVLQSKEQQVEQWHTRHEARSEERRQRHESAEKQVTQLKAARKSRAGAKDGEAERLAAEVHRQKMLASLETKIEAANQAAEERKELKRQDDEIAAFKVDLKRRQVEEERSRAKRAQAFRQVQIREQEQQEALHDQEEAAKREREAKSRLLVRDLLAKQRQEVEQYIQQHQDDATIAVPKWLEHRVALAQRSQDDDKKKSTVTKVPVPPPSGGVKQQAHTARAQRSTTKAAPRDAEDWMSSSSNGERLPAVPKGQFTMSSPRLSEKQSFGKWMFE